jgi:WD40 repeat protein
MIRIQRTRVSSVCRYIVTCGLDGDMKRFSWKELQLESIGSRDYSWDMVNYGCLTIAMSKKGDCVAVGGEDNTVSMFSYPKLEFMSLITRFQVEFCVNQ